MGKSLFLALEDEEVVGKDMPIATDAVVNENTEVARLESMVAEAGITASEHDAMNTVTAVDDAVAAVEELTDVALVMADATDKEEGIPEDAAKIAEVAVESICARLGYTHTSVIVPSMESFSFKGSKLDATKYALEAIGEVVTKVWEAVKVFFKKVWESIKALFHRLFDTTIKNEERIANITKLISNAKIKNLVPNKEKQLKLDKYCEAFDSKNVNALPEDAIKTLSAHQRMVLTRVDINKHVIKYFDMLSDTKNLDDIVNGLVKDFYVDMPEMQLALGYMIKSKDDGDKGKILSLVSNRPHVQSAESHAVTLNVLENVLKKTKELNEVLKNSKEHIRETQHAVDAATKFAVKMTKTRDVSPDGKRKAGIMRNIQTAFTLFNIKLPVLDAKLISASLGYIEANLDAYI